LFNYVFFPFLTASLETPTLRSRNSTFRCYFKSDKGLQ